MLANVNPTKLANQRRFLFKKPISLFPDDPPSVCLRCNRKMPYVSNGHCRDCIIGSDVSQLGSDIKRESQSQGFPNNAGAFSIQSLMKKTEDISNEELKPGHLGNPKMESQFPHPPGLMPNMYRGAMPGFYHMHHGNGAMHYGIQPPTWPPPPLHQQYGM